jgi:putative NADH-flavin reductase
MSGTLVIFGGTGRIGRLVLERALAAGWTVTVLSRGSSEGLPASVEVVTGDVRDHAAVERAIRGASAVVSALGARSNAPSEADALETGMRIIVAAMSEAGVSRLVTLSGAAVTIPQDSKPAIDRLASRVVRVFARHVVDAKQREYEVLAASDLRWTALRPALVRDGEARGYRLDMRLTPGARVTRADVAQALLDQVADSRFECRAPFVLPPT